MLATALGVRAFFWKRMRPVMVSITMALWAWTEGALSDGRLGLTTLGWTTTGGAAGGVGRGSWPGLQATRILAIEMRTISRSFMARVCLIGSSWQEKAWLPALKGEPGCVQEGDRSILVSAPGVTRTSWNLFELKLRIGIFFEGNFRIRIQVS